MTARKTTKAKAQTFRMTAPDASTVMLVGDFTQWQKQPINLAPQAGGVWKVKVDLAPGTYHYRFLVDGQWRDDPDCTLHVENPFGGQDAVRAVH